MSRIRIAQIGWARNEPAKTQDDVVAGFGLAWVEIDGHQVRSIMHADVSCVKLVEHPDGSTTADPLTSPVLTLEVFGSVEIVYVDEEGVALPATEKVEIDPHELPPRIEAGTKIERPLRLIPPPTPQEHR